MKDTGCAIKTTQMYRGLTLLVIGVFWWNLDMLYIMLITFFIANLKDLTQKMTDLSKKNGFCKVYIVYAFITLLLKLKNAPKFGMMFKIICQKILKIHQVFSKNYGDVRLGANYTKIKTKSRILLNTVPYSKQFMLIVLSLWIVAENKTCAHYSAFQ